MKTLRIGGRISLNLFAGILFGFIVLISGGLLYYLSKLIISTAQEMFSGLPIAVYIFLGLSGITFAIYQE